MANESIGASRHQYSVLTPDAASPILDAVISLWRKNAAQLGFFPDGAFRERASSRQILVAVNPNQNIAGYLLYRISNRQVATIVHLCVSDEVRGQGVGRFLVAELKKQTAGLRGIALSCRIDFQANDLWPRLGFIVHSERQGRSSAGSRLICWWFGFDNGDLFQTNEGLDDDTTVVAIDVNILLDLYHDNNDESRGLKADWLSSFITIAVTPETRVELLRRELRQEREDVAAYAKQFEELHGSQGKVEKLISELKLALGRLEDEQDESDIRQLAWAAVGNADLFLTRDEKLLRNRIKLQDLSALRICRPSELISQIDCEERPPQYQRARLAGTQINIQRESIVDELSLANAFQNNLRSERKTQFLEPIRKLLATPNGGIVHLVKDVGKNPIALSACDTSCKGLTRIHRLRVSASTLSGSVARYFVNEIVRSSSSELSSLCVVDDQYLQPIVATALRKEGFIEEQGLWLKCSLVGAISANKIVAAIKGLDQPILQQLERSALDRFATTLETAVETGTVANLLAAEQAIWPGTIADLAIPAFILPIKPVWAQHLFDEAIASEQLFGARLDLALNDEAIYYRSSRNNGGLRTPARLLWYVSQDSKMLPTGQIRAISHCTEITIGPAKQLFRQFRRLGTYEWRDVLETAKGNHDNDVMAIRFSKTQKLAHPVSYSALQDRLKSNGVRTQLQSPVEIPSALLIELAYGTN